MKIFLALIACLMAFSGMSQDFFAEANVPPVEQEGFYKVLLPPHLSRYLTSDFSNLRIFNGEKLTPYYIESEMEFNRREFSEYRIIDSEQKPGCCTNIVFEAGGDRPINNVHLRIRNADVSKSATLSGSDDLNNWYAIKGQFYFSPVNDPNQTFELRALDIPLSDYKYYALRFEDSTSAPLNILSIGSYKEFSQQPSYFLVGPQSVAFSDSARLGKSFISIKLDTLNRVDRISFSVSRAPYFLRDVVVYSIEALNAKRKSKVNKTILTRGQISSENPISIDLSGQRVSNLLIEIVNNDNPALHFEHLELWQKKYYAVAWLGGGVQNKIKIGGVDMASPQFDIHNFRKNVPAKIRELDPSDVILLDREFKKPAVDSFGSRQVMWIGIIGVIILLGVFSFRLIRETKASG